MWPPLRAPGASNDHTMTAPSPCATAPSPPPRGQGDALAMFELGRMSWLARGCARDHEEAMKWFRASADAGYALAQYQVGQIFQHGTDAFRRHLVTAQEYFQLAKQQVRGCAVGADFVHCPCEEGPLVRSCVGLSRVSLRCRVLLFLSYHGQSWGWAVERPPPAPPRVQGVDARGCARLHDSLARLLPPRAHATPNTISERTTRPRCSGLCAGLGGCRVGEGAPMVP